MGLAEETCPLQGITFLFSIEKMLIKSYKDVVPFRLQEGEAKGAYVRPLISDEDGAGNYHMNLLRLEPGGQTPDEKRDYSQQMFVRKGDGEVLHNSSVRELSEGDVILIREEEEYQIRNTTEADLEILIIRPAVEEDRDREESPEAMEGATEEDRESTENEQNEPEE